MKYLDITNNNWKCGLLKSFNIRSGSYTRKHPCTLRNPTPSWPAAHFLWDAFDLRLTICLSDIHKKTRPTNEVFNNFNPFHEKPVRNRKHKNPYIYLSISYKLSFVRSPISKIGNVRNYSYKTKMYSFGLEYRPYRHPFIKEEQY